MAPSCCKPEFRKWTGVLETAKPTDVCCSLKCTEMKIKNQNGKSDCTLAPACINGGKSFFGSFYGGSNDKGGSVFNKRFAHPHKSHGGKLYYTGLENSYDDLASYSQHAPETESVTVDDLMNTLVEALESEKDAFRWKSDTYSDPYTGKARFGGTDGSINFPDPQIYLHQIYGNHYGAALGQLDYRGYGYGPHSQSPHTVYGPGYFSNHYGGKGYGPGYFHRGPYIQPYYNNYGYNTHGSYNAYRNNQGYWQNSFSYDKSGGYD